ncbi:hypothetical protein GOV13_04370 [Candidatus Pacearchaeota archaeon]|nr:hypothetical protein [Candidatus Pacearchaeota archaeon]
MATEQIKEFMKEGWEIQPLSNELEGYLITTPGGDVYRDDDLGRGCPICEHDERYLKEDIPCSHSSEELEEIENAQTLVKLIDNLGLEGKWNFLDTLS